MQTHIKALLLILITCCISSILPAKASAKETYQSLPNEPIVEQDAQNVTIHWQITDLQTQQRSVAELAPSWPITEIGDVLLPAHIMTFAVKPDVLVQPIITELISSNWNGSFRARDAIVPQNIDGTFLPDLTEELDAKLPEQPILVLEEYILRGQRFAVIALVPIFQENGIQKLVRSISVSVTDAEIYQGDGAELFEQDGPIISQATGPTNSLVNQSAIKIFVSQAGIQQVTGAMLQAAGWNLANLDSSKIQLFHRGVEQAIELRLGADAKFDAQDELRFYSAAEGDRWNSEDIYWLRIGTSSGKRMVSRNTNPTGATLQNTAYQSGKFYNPQEYVPNSLAAGLDEDHWFTERLDMNPAWQAADIAEHFKIFTTTLTPTLPLVNASTTITITGSSDSGFQPTLQVTLGSQQLERTWSLTPTARNWTQTFAFSQNSANLKINLKLGSQDARVYIDQIYWNRPVSLQFANRGHFFNGVAATRTYQLTNTPTNRQLYDISDPNAPQILSLNANNQFQDGPSVRKYVLAGTGTLHTPRLQRHNPVNIAQQINAQALYIALPEFHSALQPLLKQRQSKGYSVQAVNLQAIYDGWSYGYVDPVAIRSYIRYAATGSTAPRGVILVGDGTYDPRHYTSNNVTTLPPYLLPVDPRLGETACDNCYVQVDNDNPLSDAMPDIHVGRLPIKNTAELQALVAKIIGYEQESNGLDWRSRALIVSDNYLDKYNWYDAAGNFWQAADLFSSWLPNYLQVQKLYYDPSKTQSGTWYEPDGITARNRTMQMLSQGHAIVAYVGHSHYWQWATTDLSQSPSYLMNLYDIDSLTNEGKLSIVLQMTCLTGSFHVPSAQGTSFDERLMLQKGGAVATWGSSGMAVLVGHDKLMEGYMSRLRAQPKSSMGTLTFAGYQWLLNNSACCRDLLRTFIVLGDPFVEPKIQSAQRTYLPITRR